MEKWRGLWQRKKSQQLSFLYKECFLCWLWSFAQDEENFPFSVFSSSPISLSAIVTAATRHKKGWRQAFTLLCQRAPLSPLSLIESACTTCQSGMRETLYWLGCTCLTATANSQKMVEASNIHPTPTLWKRWSNLLFPRWAFTLYCSTIPQVMAVLLLTYIKSVDCCILFWSASP